MTRKLIAGAVLTAGLAMASGAAQAGAYSTAREAAQGGLTAFTSEDLVINVQHWRGRGGPAYRGGYRGPVPGGPHWAYRPWYRRPYYGTIIGGIALGTIIAVGAYGMAPRPPRPDLCWYWADEAMSRGYWDYC